MVISTSRCRPSSCFLAVLAMFFRYICNSLAVSLCVKCVKCSAILYCSTKTKQPCFQGLSVEVHFSGIYAVLVMSFST